MSANQTEMTTRKGALTPSAPQDYLVGVRPEWLPPHISLEDYTRTLQLDYMFNTLLILLMIKENNVTNQDVKTDDGTIVKNECKDKVNNETSSVGCKGQGNCTIKRKRTTSDISLTDSDNDEDKGENKTSKSRIRKRKIIKGISITAWTVAFPVMIGLNALRGKNDDDDDDDKRDDPLRPWNYDTKYVRPHKML